MNEIKQKRSSLTGPVYEDVISKHPIFTGSCLYLGKKSICKPPIKATTTPHGTRGIPLTGNYNNPGFMLTRAFSKSHAVKYNKSKTTIDPILSNSFGRIVGGQFGSGNPPSNTLLS